MPLEKEFIENQKRILTRKKRDLEEEINRLKEQDPFIRELEDDGFRNLDDDDDAQEQVGHDDVMGSIALLQKDLEQVEKALKRIEEGTYGYDENTGEPIPIERLKAYPEATTKA